MPVRAKLTLESSSIRVSKDPTDYAQGDAFPGHFESPTVSTTSIVTSHGRQDFGLFETRLDDDRRLPFEGAGAISRWRIELPSEFRQFDYQAIDDVVLHMRYTARDDPRETSGLKTAAVNSLATLLSGDDPESASGKGQICSWSLRREFPEEWQAFVSGESNNLSITIDQSMVGHYLRDRTLQVTRFQVILAGEGVASTSVRLTQAGFDPSRPAVESENGPAVADFPVDPKKPLFGTWVVTPGLAANQIPRLRDVVVIAELSL